jgi:hypothetical protein
MRLGPHPSSADEFDFPEVVYDDGFAGGAEVSSAALTPSRDPRREEAEGLRRELEDFDIELGANSGAGEAEEHDHARGVVERLREMRARVAGLERRAGLGPSGSPAEDAARLADSVAEDVNAHGNDAQRERLSVLKRELSEAAARGDVRGVRRAAASLKELRGQVLYAQQWFWEGWFRHLRRPGTRFVNAEAAANWLAEGEEALKASDRQKLERAVRWLWSLVPPDEQAARDERAARPGLKQ